MKSFLIVFLSIFLMCTASARGVVNVYAWEGYISREVVHDFEKETGIRVNLSEYDSNEALYAKLKMNPRSRYDVVIPSSYYVKRMAAEGMLDPLDHKRLPNQKYLSPLFMHRAFDPKNNFSLPFSWGTTIMVVDKRYWNPRQVTGWSDFWKLKKKNALLIYNDVREAFAMAMLHLGYSINDQNLGHIKQAYQLLKRLLPRIKLFNTSAAASIYADGDATIGMVMSQDAFLARQENPNLVVIYPQEGFSIWIDCMALLKKAPHKEQAYRLMNYLLRPRVAAKLMKSAGFSSPVPMALDYLPVSWKNDAILNPSKEILRRGQLQESIGSARAVYQQYWYQLKLGG